MDLEKQIRDLQKELAELQRSRSVLRLQPCKGDSDIRIKDEKLDEVDRRAKILEVTLRDLTRRWQLFISGRTSDGTCEGNAPE